MNDKETSDWYKSIKSAKQFHTILGNPTIALTILTSILGISAWQFRWVQDDAFITFRYSQNLAQGMGPTWNEGQHVEGYTNFLWMVLIACAQRLGLDPEFASQALGVGFFIAALMVVYKLAILILRNPRLALVAVFITGTNYSFFMYATGGLETSLNAALVLYLLLITTKAISKRSIDVYKASMISIVASLSIMTRPDSVIACVVVFGIINFIVAQDSGGSKCEAARAILALMLPISLAIGTWLAWKYSYYNSIFPNTVYIKIAGRSYARFMRGFVYESWLFISYGWLLVALFLILLKRTRTGTQDGGSAIGRIRRHIFAPLQPQTPLVIFGVVWLAYVAWIGGDFMEFRQLIPIVPIATIFFLDIARKRVRSPTHVLILATILVIANTIHALAFSSYVRPRGISSIPTLRNFVGFEQTSWRSIGIRLRDDLGENSRLVIAVSPAGAIPYFSGLRSVDMLGLNDSWIARHGHINTRCTVCLAHSRQAPINYLESQQVNVIIGAPQIIRSDSPLANPAPVISGIFSGEELDFYNFPQDVSLLLIPLSGEYSLAAIYLLHSEEVDQLIKKNTWQLRRLTRQELKSIVDQVR